MNTLLRLENVTKTFGGLVAVNDVSFTVEEHGGDGGRQRDPVERRRGALPRA